MRMTKARLLEIIKEEVENISLSEAEPEGGEVEADAGEETKKDVQRVGDKLDKTAGLERMLGAINTPQEFHQLMVMFLEKASQHPSIKPNNVKRSLLQLAKEASGQ